ncbi:MAG: coenzyme F420-0:L-glutamate ligase [Candidatus Atabeyarchaeum deiterrae]
MYHISTVVGCALKQEEIRLEIIPIHPGMIEFNDNVIERMLQALNKDGFRIMDSDILAVTSKVISVSEGRVVELDKVTPSRKAYSLSRKYKVLPEISELIIREADMIIGGMDGVILTIKNNSLIANAGIDKKNAGQGKVVLHPRDSPKAAKRIRTDILNKTGKKIGVIIADTRTQPLRIGVIGIALAVSGFEPIVDERGRSDLFGRPLQVTKRALADQLATAAEILMGETNECTPAVLIRGAPVTLNDLTPLPKMQYVPPDECFYTKILSRLRRRSQSKDVKPHRDRNA